MDHLLVHKVPNRRVRHRDEVVEGRSQLDNLSVRVRSVAGTCCSKRTVLDVEPTRAEGFLDCATTIALFQVAWSAMARAQRVRN